jgi:hypothetical protein
MMQYLPELELAHEVKQQVRLWTHFMKLNPNCVWLNQLICPTGHAQEPVLKMPYWYGYILMCIQIDTFKVFLWVRIKIPCGQHLVKTSWKT